MKSSGTILVILSALASAAYAFTTPTTTVHAGTPRPQSSSQLHAYVPDGLSAEEWRKIKTQEANRYKGVNLGRLGPRGFKSRSMEAWQKAYERGEADHSFAPINLKERLRQGLISKRDIPYMVRGGSWDNSDLFGVRRLKWLREDREYARGGFRKQQSASILGSGPGFDWAGKRSREENLQNKVVPGLS